MTRNCIEEIELNIKQAQKIVKHGAALERLYANRDFKEVILEGYMEREAIRLVHLKADVGMQAPAMQAALVTQIDAIGALGHFFKATAMKAALAEKAIESDRETHAELMLEGADE